MSVVDVVLDDDFFKAESFSEAFYSDKDSCWEVFPEEVVHFPEFPLFNSGSILPGPPAEVSANFRHSPCFYWSEKLKIPALSVFSLHNAHVFGGKIRERRGKTHGRGQLTLRSGFQLFSGGSFGIMDGISSLPSDLMPSPTTLDRSGRAEVCMPGAYYLIGSIHSHFGHFLLEGLARLWALEYIPSDVRSTLKFLVYEPEISPYARKILEYLGLHKEQIVHCPEYGIVEQLIVPSPGMRTHWWIHPSMKRVWELISDAAASEKSLDFPAKIFLSRRGVQERATVNIDEVENLFTRHGYKIIHPEKFPIGDQIRIARSAHMLAGCVGSQLYLAMFRKLPGSTFVVAPEDFFLKDDLLISSLSRSALTVAMGGRRQGGEKRWEADMRTLEAALLFHEHNNS